MKTSTQAKIKQEKQGKQDQSDKPIRESKQALINGKISTTLRMPLSQVMYLRKLAWQKSVEQERSISWIKLAVEAIAKAYPVDSIDSRDTNRSIRL